MDCSRYENSIRIQQAVIDMTKQNILHIIAVGCWGVYCQDGEYLIAKYKKGKIDTSKVQRGQKKISEALIQYTKEHQVSDMYLAGDNVYQVGVKTSDPDLVDEFLRNKQMLLGKIIDAELDPLENFDMDLQISQGFENCFRKARVDRFFLAIGNHDIETCGVLNKQYNYEGWNIPSLYYNVIYKMNNFTINIIVLDTNMFEDDPLTCSKIPFTRAQIDNQISWALEASRKGDWNIVIGHIPYLANGHKANKHPVTRRELSVLISQMNPQLYICADEHNQQFIQTKHTAIVIAGTGGTQLDPVISDNVVPGTLYQNSDYAFVAYDIDQYELKLSFISARNEVLFSYVLKRV
jgi:hypothetical protein